MAVAQEGKRLTARDWATAALEMIGDRGVSGVAVEPLATRLGTTKGSFYWHYANRDALIEAALALWEEAHTEAVIEATKSEAEPDRRLHRLFTTVSAGRGTIEVNLLAAADHLAVAPAMQRVVLRRLGYMTDIFIQLGCSEDDARRRALLAYSVYLGSTELAIRLPGITPGDKAAQQAYVDLAVTSLLP